MAPDSSKGKAGFRLPSDISFEKQRLCDAWAYVFRHRVLGELGRMLLQELGDGRCHLSCEMVGDAADPMTAQRPDVLKVWPARGSIKRWRPAQLNARIDQLATGHCGAQVGGNPDPHGRR
jgi:hypothetical protein